jgi:hypothetical protein
MANITGTNKRDWLEGTSADDILTGKKGGDTFVLRANGGDDVITDFNIRDDQLLFDSGTGVNDGVLPPLGHLEDGQVFSNSQGTASWTVQAVDANGDGITDTLITMSTGGSITLLGVAPEELASGHIFGG